jgi:hypothetical protein
MKENCFILAAIHPLAEPGNRHLGDEWPAFLGALRNSLQHQGLEDQNSSEVLLLFRFEKPLTAIASFVENLNRLKEEFSWQKSYDPPPLQAVFHLEMAGDLSSPLRDPSATLWDILKTEYPYITHSLKLEWGQLIDGEKFPPHDFGDEETGFYPLRFADLSQVKTERLFPFRSLPLAGQFNPCFYCGMTVHNPANCPSKQLSMAIHALDKIGYLPLSELAGYFQDAFNHQERLNLLLADGLISTDLRKNFSLQLFVASFDLMGVYQIRFLSHLAFSPEIPWEDLVRRQKSSGSNHALHLAFDCLRVGQYAEAEELLFEESHRQGGKQFHATVGRAFIALEQGLDSDLGHFLESASTMASTENEKVYISLLLSRYFELQGHRWKAEHALDNVFSLGIDCTEAVYRQIQLAASQSFSNRELHQLRFLVAEQKEYFMRAFLDPLLLPVYGLVEDMLALHLEARREEAEERLAKLRAQCRELEEWLVPDDEYLQSVIQETGMLDEQFQLDSYYDYLAVADAAKRLVHESYQLQENRLDEMMEKKDRALAAHEGYVGFWNRYPYHAFFQEFQEILTKNKEKLLIIQTISDQEITGKGYRQITAILGEIDELRARLQAMVGRMGLAKVFFDGVKLFVKRLLLTEIILLLLCLISLPVLAFWLGDNATGSGLVARLQTPWVQKRILFIITLVIAPTLALAQTLWKSADADLLTVRKG